MPKKNTETESAIAATEAAAEQPTIAPTPEEVGVPLDTTPTRVHYAGPFTTFTSPTLGATFERDQNSAEVPKHIAAHLIANKGFREGFAPAEQEQAKQVVEGSAQ